VERFGGHARVRVPTGSQRARVSPWDVAPSRGVGMRPNKYVKEHLMILNKIRRFLESEDGPTAVEYAVMLALIIVVCLISIQALGSATSTSFSNLSQSLGTGS